ncbi:MAG: tyrosine protein phosphatase, partial [Pseudomonadota bacterium]
AREWDRQAPLLIHCYAGVSRSTASAYIIAHALRQDPDPIALASDLRFRSPTATPNAKLIAIGDVLLGMDGAMSSAIAEIGRGAYCFEGEPFVFPVDPEHDTMW